jgi:predicted XRE-type DNA-binding protein
MNEIDTTITMGSSNVYADIGMPDAEGMFVKAQLAMRISDAIRAKRLTQAKAAVMVGMTQPKLSNMLRGQFRGVSETKMMDCLTALGKNIEIIVRSAPRGQAGRVQVVSREPAGHRRASARPVSSKITKMA